jgi:adenylyltransferase/sulfurtransferase
MMDREAINLPRYHRQQLFAPLGREGQERILRSKVLIVGIGGLGSWLCELLVRAGVGWFRLVDRDTVDWTNIARQAMYDELDAAEHSPKVFSAAEYLGRINHNVDVEPIQDMVTRDSVARLAEGVDIILDGTDDWATRFLINDYAVKTGIPWVFAGVVRAEGQIMPILPGRTACLRCVFEDPPPPENERKAKAAQVGVLGTAVATLAALEANEALKILSGRPEMLSPYLTKLDLWANAFRQINTTGSAKNNECICCKQREFTFLDA